MNRALIRYKIWWEGKRCRPRFHNKPFKLVRRVVWHGPPSGFYGACSLEYEDGTKDTIPAITFKPTKDSVEIEPSA